LTEHIELRNRVCSEYLEMPGLKLSVPQACRLWNTDPVSSQDVLSELVEAAFLRRRGDFYLRADAGRWSA
jgi:hypothetical protein